MKLNVAVTMKSPGLLAVAVEDPPALLNCWLAASLSFESFGEDLTSTSLAKWLST
jgi:hypothetical protein